MTKHKRSVSELLRLACIHAETDLESAAQAWGDEPQAKEYRELLEEIREYRTKRWGRTALEAVLENAKPVSIADVIRGKTDE